MVGIAKKGLFSNQSGSNNRQTFENGIICLKSKITNLKIIYLVTKDGNTLGILFSFRSKSAET